MKNFTNFFATFLILFIVSLSYTSAQETQEKIVDGETFTYTKTVTELEGVTMYYNEETLLFAEVDKDGNGTTEQWVLFDEDTTVRKELRDSDGDGTPDITFTYAADEELVASEGEGLNQYEPVIEQIETSGEASDAVEDVTDYAGDLSDIEKLAGESGGWWRWLLFLCIVGGGAYWWKRNKQKQQ